MTKLKMEWVYNASYSPNYNPIEGVISVAKSSIKKKRLRALVLNEKIDMER